MRTRQYVHAAAFGALLVLCAGARAGPATLTEPLPAQDALEAPASASAESGARVESGATAEPGARLVTGWGAPAQQARLARLRGGDDTVTVTNTARLSGVVSGNSATNVNTGANSIDAGSFANVSGLPMVIQNSGANVLIQNATVINLQLK